MRPADLSPPELSVNPHASPKRKRNDEDDIDMPDIGRSPMRMRIESLTPPVHNERNRESSPRSRMSNQMQSLEIKHDNEISQFSLPTRSLGTDYQNSLSFCGEIPENNVGPTGLTSPCIEGDVSVPRLEVLETPQTSFSSTSIVPEQPQTPKLKPAPSPMSAPQVISPLPPSSPATSISAPTTPTSTKRKANVRKSPPPIDQLPPPFTDIQASPDLHTQGRRRGSPPPFSCSQSDLVWSDSEITGHNPSDPEDDGYGINGIGFRPTAQMEEARSKKRKAQMAEWKKREAGEARQRRAQNRQRGVGGMRFGRDAPGGSGALEDGVQSRKVRFVES